MLKTIVTTLLDQYLGDYLLGLKEENLKLAIVDGNIRLKNLEINPESFSEMNLPIKIKKGTLGSVNLSFPWSKDGNESTNINIDDLCLLIGPKTNEYDENCELKIKQKMLKLNEVLNSGENGSKKQQDNVGWIDNFITSVYEKFLNNLQVDINRIHIRYEDDVSNKERPFAFGVTLDYLQAQSADENWIPSIITETQTTFHKLINLKGLAIYWNSNDKFVDWNKENEQESLASFSKVMTDLIPKENNNLYHQYILEPVDATLKIIYKKEDILDMQLPILDISIHFDRISVALNEFQYKDFLYALDNYSNLIKNHNYKHLRPKDLPNERKNYKLWWNYLTDAVLLEYRAQKKLWNWNFLKQMLSDRKVYIDLWYKKRANIEYDVNVLEELERRLSYETLVSFRELGDALYRQQKLKSEQRANEENSNKSFLGKILFSSKPKLEESIEITPKVIMDLHQTLENEKLAENKFIVEYVKMRVDLEVEKIAFKLNNASFFSNQVRIDPLLDVNLESFKIDLKFRENSFSTFGFLNRFTATHYSETTNGRSVSLISPRSICREKKQLEFEFHYDPLRQIHNADTKIVLNAQSLDIFFSMKLIDKISSFFSSPIENSVFIEQESIAANETKHSLQLQAEFLIKYALNSKKRVDVSVNILAPRIHIPQDPNNEKSTKLVLDLGRITLSTDPVNSQTSLIKEGQHLHVMVDSFYEKFDLKLTDLEVTVVDVEFEKISHIKEPPVLTFNFQIIFNILLNTVSLLPKIKISSRSLSPLTACISSQRISQILGVLKSLSVEKELDEIKELANEKRKKLKSYQALVIKKKQKQLEAFKVSEISKEIGSDENFLSNLIGENEQNTEFLENLKKNDISFDEREFSDPNNPKQFSLSFEVPQIKLLLYKTKKDSFKKLITVELEKFDLLFEQKKHSMSLESSIGGVFMKDRIQKWGKELKMMVDSNIGSEEKELINLKYEGVPKTSKLFQGVEHNVNFSFNGLSFMLNRETVIYLLNFMGEINSNNKQAPSKETKNLAFEEISQNKIEDKKQISTIDEEDKTLMLKLLVNVGAIRGSLNREGAHVLIFSIGSSNADIEMRNNGTMKIESNMGKFEVIDGTEVGEYSKVITTNLEKTFSLSYQTFNKISQEFEQHDAEIVVDVSSVEIIFLNKFIDNLLDYFYEMRLNSKTKDKPLSVKEVLKPLLERKSKMKLEVKVNNPFIIIPTHSSLKDILVVDLGEISIKLNQNKNNEQEVNVIEANLKEMNIAISHFSDMKKKVYLIERTSMNVTVERLIDLSSHKIPATTIKGKMNEMKLNMSDFTFGKIVEVLEGNLCETIEPNNHRKLSESQKLELEKEEETIIEKIEPPKDSNEDWEEMLINFLLEHFTISLAKGGTFEEASSEIALLEIKKMGFNMKNRNNQTMDIDVYLTEILFFDKQTKNSKFPELLSPLSKDKESRLIGVELIKDEKGNQNISVVLEDIRMQLVPEPIWELNVWMLPLLNKFLSGLDSWVKNQQKQSNQIEIKEQSEQDGELNVELIINRSELVLIQDVTDEKSNSILLDSQITFTFESSKKLGMMIGLNMSNLSLSKFCFGDKIEPTIMIEPWYVTISVQDSKGFREVEVNLQQISLFIPIQIFQLLMKTQEKWSSVISGSNQQKSSDKKDISIEEKRIEVIEEKEIYESDNVVDKKPETTKEDIMTFIAKTGNINLTLVDDFSDQNDPILLLKLQSGIVELTFNGGEMQGIINSGIQIDYFNSNNQNWEPFLRSISNNREENYKFNTLIKKKNNKDEIDIKFSSVSSLALNISKNFLISLESIHQNFISNHNQSVIDNNLDYKRKLIVRNETGEDLLFCTTGSTKMHKLSFQKEKNELPIDLGIQRNLDFEQRKREIEKRSINFTFVSSKDSIKELPINVIKTYNIPINKNQTAVYEVSYQSGSKICTLKSSFTLENKTELPLYVGIKHGEIITVLPDMIYQESSFSIPMKYVGESIVVSPDPEKYEWSDAINMPKLIEAQNKLSNSQTNKRLKKKLSEEIFERVLKCTSKIRKTRQQNTQIESNNQIKEVDDEIHDDFKVNETNAIRKSHLPFFLSVKINAENDLHFNSSRFNITIKPPLLLSNVLAVPLKFWLFNIKEYVEDGLDEGTILNGEKLSLHCFDPRNQDVGMSVKIYGFYASTIVNITGNPNDLATSIPMFQTSNNPQKRCLLISIDYLRENYCTELSLYVNYWIINKTNLRLVCKDPKKEVKDTYKTNIKIWEIEEKERDVFDWFERDEEKIKKLELPLMHNSDDLKVKVGKAWSNTVTLTKHSDEGVLEIEDDKRSFVFGLSISSAPGQFWRTKILKLVNKYILVNNTKKVIQYKQPNSKDFFTLKPGHQTYFHWPSKDLPKMLCIKYDGEEYPTFSGAFQIVGVSLFECKIKNTLRKEQLNNSAIGEERITVQTSTNQITTAIIFREERGDPLYILRNNTSKKLEFRQKNSKIDENNPTILLPRSQVAYAWSEPSLEKKKIIFGVEGFKAEKPSEFSLDEIRDDFEKIVVTKTFKQTHHKQTVLSPRIYFEGVTRVFEISDLKEISEEKFEQFIHNKQPKFVDANKISFSLSINIPGFGLSVLSDSPQEIMNLYLDTISLDYEYGNKEQILNFKIKRLQIDNQLFNTPHPIVLNPTHNLFDEDNFLHFAVSKSNLHKNIHFFNGIKLKIQNFDLKVDQAFLTHMIDVFLNVIDYFSSINMNDEEIDYTKKQEDLTDMMYFKTLLITPVKANISYAACSWGAKDLQGTNVGKILDIIGKITDMENAPLQLDSLEMKNLFLTRSDLISKLKSFYIRNIMRKFYLLLGSLNILGNPVSLFQELGEGVKEIVAEPPKGLNQSPEKIVVVSERSGSLFRRIITGAFGPTEKIIPSIGNATTNVYIDKKKVRRPTEQHRIRNIGLGTGTTGIVAKPVTGQYECTRKLRIRAPRFIDKSCVVTEFNAVNSEGQEILKTLEGGLFDKETYQFHFPNLSSIPLNGNVLILGSNKHIFLLKRNKMGRIMKEWMVAVDKIDSIAVNKRGISIKLSKPSSGKDNRKNISFPYNMGLYVYFRMNDLLKSQVKIQNRVNVTTSTNRENINL